MSFKFSTPKNESVAMTPLGAAIVEAMPDRKLVNRINRRFKSHNECPASLIFSPEEVEEFYKARGQDVKAV